MFYVVDNMKQSALYQEMAIESLKGYALSEKYVQRETFAWMIPNLYQLKLFEEKLLDHVELLSKDPIVIVRIALSISIAEILRKDPNSINLFSKVVQNLSQDI